MQIVDDLKLKGKTIERTVFVSCGEKLVIVFTNGDYVVFCIVGGYDDEVELSLSTLKLGNYDRFCVGLITQEELDSAIEKEKQQSDRHTELRDRELLERLKKKYEGGNQ